MPRASTGDIVLPPQKHSSVVVMALVAWFLAGANTWPGTLGPCSLPFPPLRPDPVPDLFSIHRQHTGERPFTCQCGKQFSRLDNLRQHAQTVHADQQDVNEKMMRDLTSLHASMTAAAKSTTPRS